MPSCSPLPARCGSAPSELSPLLRLWLLRLLVPLGGHRHFIFENGFRDEALAEALGLAEGDDSFADDLKPKAVRTKLRQLHATAERKPCADLVPSCLSANLERLFRLVGMLFFKAPPESQQA